MELELLKEYKRLLTQEKVLTKRKEEIKEALIDMGSDFVTLVESNRTSVNAKRLSVEYPEIYARVVEIKKFSSVRVKV